MPIVVSIHLHLAYISQHVKQAILDEKYSKIVRDALVQHLKDNTSKATDMVHTARKTIWEEQFDLATVKVGDWVEVIYEYEPGTCSDGGIGVITRLVETDNEPGSVVTSLFATVQYVLDNRKEHGVSMDRLTIIPMPFKSDVTLRPRTKQQAPKNFEKLVEKRTPLGWLKWGLTTRKHEKKGWLAETLLANGELAEGEAALWQRVLSDYRPFSKKCCLRHTIGVQNITQRIYVFRDMRLTILFERDIFSPRIFPTYSPIFAWISEAIR